MYSIVLEDRKSLNVNTFRIQLQQKGTFNGTINWLDEDGVPYSSLGYTVNTIDKFIELSYSVNDDAYYYEVGLETLPSNLGKGCLWYFICPATNKRCRKLHFVNGYFYHRSAFKKVYYKAQTYSKEFRSSELKYIQNQFEIAELLNEINAPYFKHHYKGKPTNKVLSYINKLEKLSGKDLSNLK